MKKPGRLRARKSARSSLSWHRNRWKSPALFAPSMLRWLAP